MLGMGEVDGEVSHCGCVARLGVLKEGLVTGSRGVFSNVEGGTHVELFVAEEIVLVAVEGEKMVGDGAVDCLVSVGRTDLEGGARSGREGGTGFAAEPHDNNFVGLEASGGRVGCTLWHGGDVDAKLVLLDGDKVANPLLLSGTLVKLKLGGSGGCGTEEVIDEKTVSIGDIAS